MLTCLQCHPGMGEDLTVDQLSAKVRRQGKGLEAVR